MGQVEIIAALGQRGEIGYHGTMPWHLPEDLRHFKSLTLGRSVIMGRRTYESIGRPLPERRNIVLSRSLTAPPSGIETAASLEAALALVADDDTAMVIGGAEVYTQALPLTRVLHLTRIWAEFNADTFFPRLDESLYTVAETARMTAGSGLTYSFATLRRK